LEVSCVNCLNIVVVQALQNVMDYVQVLSAASMGGCGELID